MLPPRQLTVQSLASCPVQDEEEPSAPAAAAQQPAAPGLAQRALPAIAGGLASGIADALLPSAGASPVPEDSGAGADS
jgi:predicted lipid-binding transport protein (Tim44 family)